MSIYQIPVPGLPSVRRLGIAHFISRHPAEHRSAAFSPYFGQTFPSTSARSLSVSSLVRCSASQLESYLRLPFVRFSRPSGPLRFISVQLSSPLSCFLSGAISHFDSSQSFADLALRHFSSRFSYTSSAYSFQRFRLHYSDALFRNSRIA